MKEEAGVAESLKFYAKQLRLPTFACIADVVRKFQPGQSLDSFTLELLKREYVSRQENQLKRRIKRAKFPMLKTFEEFQLERLQHVRPEFVKQLVSCEATGKL